MFDLSDEPEVHYGRHHAPQGMSSNSQSMGMEIDDSTTRRGAGIHNNNDDDDVIRNVVCTKQHERRLNTWVTQNEPYTTNSNQSPSVVKIALSLFKVQQSIYLLDFQRVEGDAYGFMKLCALIVAELKNLSSASRGSSSSINSGGHSASGGGSSHGHMHPPNPSLSRGVPVAVQSSGQHRR